MTIFLIQQYVFVSTFLGSKTQWNTELAVYQELFVNLSKNEIKLNRNNFYSRKLILKFLPVFTVNILNCFIAGLRWSIYRGQLCYKYKNHLFYVKSLKNLILSLQNCMECPSKFYVIPFRILCIALQNFT